MPGPGAAPGAYDAVVFDLDGTLVDSATAMQAIAAVFFREIGAEPLDLGETRRCIGWGVAAFLEKALAARGLSPDRRDFQRLLDRFSDLYGAAPGEANTPFPGVDAALGALARHAVPMAICTNKPARPTANLLRALGWQSHFRAVITGDSLEKRKPDPAPLRLAVEQLAAHSVPSRVLYVGDSEIDAAAVAAAGLPFALYLGGYHTAPVSTLAPTHAFTDYAALVGLVTGGS